MKKRFELKNVLQSLLGRKMKDGDGARIMKCTTLQVRGEDKQCADRHIRSRTNHVGEMTGVRR